MMMTLRQWIRAFLGIDALPSRLEIIEIRQLIEQNQRELRECIAKLAIYQQKTLPAVEFYEISTPNVTWEQVEMKNLIELMQNPPKES